MAKRISLAPQLPKSSASAIVAHLNLSIPCFLCSWMTSPILWVFIWGLRYCVPPAMAIMVLIFAAIRSGYTTRQGVIISLVSVRVYHLFFVMLRSINFEHGLYFHRNIIREHHANRTSDPNAVFPTEHIGHQFAKAVYNI